AVEVAKNAAKGISELQSVAEPEPGLAEGKAEESETKEAAESEAEKMRKLALDKLEKASEDSGLKVLDSSVENITSGAWQALNSAWKGGSTLVHKLESSATNLADSIQHGGLPVNASSLAPSIIETGKAFTAKGMQVLEFVGKETIDLLIDETGIEVDKDPSESEQHDEEEQFSDDISFDRCFYIYGGPEQLEELEALSNHHMLLFNRKKTKLPPAQKALYDGELKQVKLILTLNTENDGSSLDLDKGKTVENIEVVDGSEMKALCESSVSKAADMAAGFAAALEGIAANEIIQRTTGRLEAIHSEGVHRLSELCCFGVSQLLMLGKSMMSSVHKSQDDEIEEDGGDKIEWPNDSISKAKLIRLKAQAITGDVAAVSNSFVTGISDVLEAYVAAVKKASTDSGLLQDGPIHEKTHAISDHLHTDKATAIDKIQDGLQYLAYIVISTSMTTA
ncbi:hypothetical protein EJ110_NYTH47245, partial [Nymphaea thermarum]